MISFNSLEYWNYNNIIEQIDGERVEENIYRLT
jgi:hypothetical protein